MKNILVLVHDDEGQESRLQVALDVAKTLEAHLTCLHETLIPEFVGSYALQGAPLLIAREEGLERLNRPRVEQRLAREGVSVDWIEVTGFAAPATEQHLGLVDLVILSRRLDHDRMPDMVQLADNLLRRSRKPLLLVPPSAGGLDLHGTAMVAWDGSAQAEAALTAAVPLLRHAAQVALVQIEDRPVEVSTSDAARYLRREGMEVTSATLAPSDYPIPQMLLQHGQDIGATYLVAGAYRHGPTFEKLFGGVTRHLIRHSPIPVLLAR